MMEGKFPSRTRVALLVMGLAAIVAVVIWLGVRPTVVWRRAEITEARMQYNWYLLDQYFSKTGGYPEAGTLGSVPNTEISLGGYRRKLASTDGWGVPLVYYCSADGLDYRMISFGGRGFIEGTIDVAGYGRAAGREDPRSNVVFGGPGILASYIGFAMNHPFQEQNVSEDLAIQRMHSMDWSLPPSARPVPSVQDHRH
jgi:hypothetical protein